MSKTPLMEMFFGMNGPEDEDPKGSEEVVTKETAVKPVVSPTASFQEVRRLVEGAAERGTICPCCDQFVKIYRRKLNANMAEFLCSLVVNYLKTGDWVSFKDCRFNGRDYSYISLWELAETRNNTDPKKKHSGFWRPTQKGIDFARGKISVPSHVFVYDNKVRSWAATHVSVREVFEKHFDYSELMGP